LPTLMPDPQAWLEDESHLHIPVQGLFADVDAAAGSVALTDDFLRLPASVRAEVLQHWVRGLEEKRHQALADMFREVSAPLTKLSIVEQIDNFRHVCSQLGVDCPGELPLLLQRY
jgi:acyl-CoA reductase-like NAD-dependent aldehyde dehydrogenase